MRARYLTPIALALLVALLLAAAPALADGTFPAGKVDPSVLTELDAVGNGNTVPVIVYAVAGRLDDLSAAIAAKDGSDELALIGAVATDVSNQSLSDLANLACVDYVAADVPVFATDYVDTLDVTNATLGLGALTPPAAGGPSGRGVSVAVLDSGSADNPDLDDQNGDSRVIAWRDFVNGWRRPYDDGGHGTFVDGLIAGNGSLSLPRYQGGQATTQFRGVAPGADIVSLKVLDSHGEGRSSSLIAAIAWAIAHKNQYNIRVMNISVEGSVAGPARYDPMARAVEAAWKAGIVVVCAAGNEGDFGPGSILSPGNDPYVITVGALDTKQTAGPSDDSVCHYSSIGPTMYDEYAKPDVVAPGNRLVSLRARWSYIDRTYPQNRLDVSTYVPGAPSWMPAQYFIMSGTSTSAPVVSGAAALIVAQDPSLTPDDVKVRLMQTADSLPGVSTGVQGAGEVDVPRALASSAHANGYALSADLGDGHTVLPPDVELQWQRYAWSRYAWSRYGWSRYGWSRYGWSRYAWSRYAWSRYAWSVVIDGE